MKTITRLQFIALIILLASVDSTHAQSVTVPTVTVSRGDTGNVALSFITGGGATNLDFAMTYDETVINEAAITFTCNPAIIGLTSLTCAVDQTNNQVKGIGVNLSSGVLASGAFAVIDLPVRADAAIGHSIKPINEHFATETIVTSTNTLWTLNVIIDTCNVKTVSGVAEYFDTSHEACEILVLGPDFIAADGSNVSVNSGWEIDFMPGFMVEQGATLNANVCGQSLCLTSPNPMPYGCHSCVDQICDIDPSCCALEFDQECLDRVSADCGLVCE